MIHSLLPIRHAFRKTASFWFCQWTALAGLLFFVMAASGVMALEAELALLPRPKADYRVWPSAPPADCPFPPSDDIRAIAFTGRYANYTGADTWYPSWAGDGRMFSCFTDGTVNGLFSASIDNFQGKPQAASTGSAIITGDDPFKLVVSEERIFRSRATPGGLFKPTGFIKGRYPCANLYHDGVWYIGTYCLSGEPEGYNYGVMGPFVGFRWSLDDGVSWTDTDHKPESPLFAEETFGRVKLGELHFVDFGRNLEHSPDGKAYLVGHGALEDDPDPRPANCSWINGDQVFMTRVEPSPQNINDPSKYEFFAGHDEDGNPVWSKDYKDLKPLIDWNNNCGCVTMTYNAPLGKYLMAVTDGWPTINAPFDTYILESDSMTGPWKMVAWMEDFGQQAYFVNFPSKFTGEDGRKLFLCYSANYAPIRKDGSWLFFKPRGSTYSMCLQEVKLLSSEEEIENHPVLDIHRNIAPLAAIRASSVYPGSSLEGLVDGAVDPAGTAVLHREWASHAQKEGAFVTFEWRSPVKINRVILFDRPNTIDQVTSARLIFGDGQVLETGALPDGAAEGLDLQFEEVETSSLTVFISGVKEGTANSGFGEVAIMGGK